MPASNWKKVLSQSALSLFLSSAATTLAVISLFTSEDDEKSQNWIFGFEAGLYFISLLLEFKKNLNRIEDAAVAYLFKEQHTGVPKGASVASWMAFLIGILSIALISVFRYQEDSKDVASVIGIIAPLVTGSINLIIETGYSDLAQEAVNEVNKLTHDDGQQVNINLDDLSHLRREFGIHTTLNRCFRFFWGTTLNHTEINERCKKANCLENINRNPILSRPQVFPAPS